MNTVREKWRVYYEMSVMKRGEVLTMQYAVLFLLNIYYRVSVLLRHGENEIY